MELRTTAEATYEGTREAVFDVLVTAATYPRILRRLGPLPGVVKSEMIGGQPLEVGARRMITLDDDSTLEEEVIAFERPVEHAYRWGAGLTAPLSWLVRGGTGRWKFHDEAGRTRVQWSYTFELRSVLAYPMCRAVVVLFGAWMRRGLAAGRDEIARQLKENAAATACGRTP